MRRLVVACLLTLVVLPGLASEQEPQNRPVFRTRTDLIELDVSVLDKNRRPVRGLTAADFIVLEDGVEQPISVFEAVDVPDPVEPPAAWMRDVTPDVSTNESKGSRLWVLVIDDALIPYRPFATKSSAELARDVIRRLGPDDLATIVFTTDSSKAQDFTNDRAKLLATLEGYRPGWATGHGSPDAVIGVDPDWQFQLGALLTVRNVVDTLISVAHTRKALIWITPGVGDLSFIFKPTEAPRSAQAAGATMARPQAQLRMIEICKEIFETARRANLPIFPLMPGDNGMPQNDFNITVANNTGGHAYVDASPTETALAKIFTENSSYYLIGYNPKNTKLDGTYRRIEVKVDLEDVEVRTRSQYIAPKAADVSAPSSTNRELLKAVAAPVALRDLSLRAAVAPFANPEKPKTAIVPIALGVQHLVPEAAARGRLTATTELRASANTTEGDEFGTQRQTANVVLRPGAQGVADYEVLSKMELPPGRYRIRLAAIQEDTSRTGTVMADVIVPDFAREPASMSGVVIGTMPALPSAPKDLLARVLPFAPTSRRSFDKTDRATALLYVYQNGLKPVAAADLAISVDDGMGARVLEEKRSLTRDAFVSAKPAVSGASTSTPSGLASPRPASTTSAPRSLLAGAEVRYPLPIEKLTPGRYLLTFKVRVGQIELRRDVQFEIK